MSDLIKTVAVLLLWSAAVMFSRLFVRYARTAEYTDFEISSLLLVFGAWLSMISYLIIVARLK